MTTTARPATLADVPALNAIQARIIRIGGTTAHEVPRTDEAFAAAYIAGPDCICCHAAEMDGRLIGFQTVGRHPDLPEGWGDIGTFVDPEIQRSGAGHVLFAASLAAARAAGLTTLNATIRADNVPGLGYYGGLGFADYGTEPGYALKSGKVVGRVHRRFEV